MATDLRCTMMDDRPACPVGQIQMKKLHEDMRIKDPYRRQQDLEERYEMEKKRFKREKEAAIERYCENCGFEVHEAAIRKANPAPWRRAKDGTLYRDWRRQG